MQVKFDKELHLKNFNVCVVCNDGSFTIELPFFVSLFFIDSFRESSKDISAIMGPHFFSSL